jgi:hypothetical protein
MLSFTRSSILLLFFCLFLQAAIAREYKSPGFDAHLARILKQLDEEKGKNVTDSPSVPMKTPAGPSGGVFFMYPNTNCRQVRPRPFLIRPVDKCFNIEDSFSLKTEAKCVNGTVAKIAAFKSPKCQNPLENAFEQVSSAIMECQDTSDIGSMMFWCDGPSGGLDLSENVGMPSHGNKGSAAGAFTILLIILFILMIGIITTLLKFRNLLTTAYDRLKVLGHTVLHSKLQTNIRQVIVNRSNNGHIQL